MNLLSFLSAATPPNDLWTIMINWVNGGVANFGWAILLATIIVKLALTPLDVMVKYNSKKQMLIQQKCAPQIMKLQKKFGNDQQTLKVQQSSLYKREGLNVGTGCIIMVINLIATMVIFFTFFTSLRNVSGYQTVHEYEQVFASYQDNYYNSLINNDKLTINTKEEADAWLEDMKTLKSYIDNADNETNGAEYQAKLNDYNTNYLPHAQKATDAASNACLKKWNDSKSSWLWVQNIWISDSNVKPFPYFKDFQNIAKNGGYGKYINQQIDAVKLDVDTTGKTEKEIHKLKEDKYAESYNKIAKLINDNSKQKDNGYFILAILAGGLTFLTQWITELHNKLKDKKANKLAKATNTNGMSMKVMKIIMPIMMVMFVISSSASFGIYILSSNLAALVFGEIETLIVDAMTKKKRLEVEEALAKEADRLIRKGKLQG